MFKIQKGKEVAAMYGNNYPNDYENRNAVDSTAREVKAEGGNFSGQSSSVYQEGSGYQGQNEYEGIGNTENGSAGNSGNRYEKTENIYGNGGSTYRNESTYNSAGKMYGSGGNGYGISYTGSQKPPKKEKKSGGSYWKKALAAVSFGLLFGGFAGLGFYGIDAITNPGNSDGKTEAVAEAAEEMAQSAKETVGDGDGVSDDGVIN